MRRIETASLHRGIAGSQHSFLPVPPGANKMQQLLQVRCLQPRLVSNVLPADSYSRNRTEYPRQWPPSTILIPLIACCDIINTVAHMSASQRLQAVSNLCCRSDRWWRASSGSSGGSWCSAIRWTAAAPRSTPCRRRASRRAATTAMCPCRHADQVFVHDLCLVIHTSHKYNARCQHHRVGMTQRCCASATVRAELNNLRLHCRGVQKQLQISAGVRMMETPSSRCWCAQTWQPGEAKSAGSVFDS